MNKKMIYENDKSRQVVCLARQQAASRKLWPTLQNLQIAQSYLVVPTFFL